MVIADEVILITRIATLLVIYSLIDSEWQNNFSILGQFMIFFLANDFKINYLSQILLKQYLLSISMR